MRHKFGGWASKNGLTCSYIRTGFRKIRFWKPNWVLGSRAAFLLSESWQHPSLYAGLGYGKRPQNRSENLFAPEPLSERRDVSAAPGWPPAQCDIRLRLRHRGKSRESCKSLLFFLSTDDRGNIIKEYRSAASIGYPRAI